MTLLAKRVCKAKNRLRSSKEENKISSHRQIIETAFSCIVNLFPRCLRASPRARLFSKSILFDTWLIVFHFKISLN